MSFVLVHDAIHDNVSRLPAGPAAGYTTGTPDIAWTPQDFARHPGAVRICQDVGATDETADVLDVERYAATNADAGGWYKRAIAAFANGVRPGQRWPMIYTSAGNVTPLVNELIAEQVHSGPRLFVADWNLSDPEATAMVAAASGPYPIAAVQFASGEFYDTSIFASSWLSAVSRSSVPSGPYRHVLTRKSIAELAAERHTTVAHLLATTAEGYTSRDAQTVIDGMIVYTTNP